MKRGAAETTRGRERERETPSRKGGVIGCAGKTEEERYERGEEEGRRSGAKEAERPGRKKTPGRAGGRERGPGRREEASETPVRGRVWNTSGAEGGEPETRS